MNKLLPFVLLLFSTTLFAQEVVSSSGAYISNANGSISFTVGEVSIQTIATGSNVITQGFHQTNLGVLAVDDVVDDLSIKVFPNPTSELLQISINDFTNKSYQLFDITGKLISKNVMNKTLNEVNLAPYANGIYLLVLYNENNNRIQTYRIIKN